jgi:uncharacterized protein related to proFAR isomerase
MDYRPIVTALASSSNPVDVAKGLYKFYPFRKFYVADLDGIEGRGRNVHLVPSLSAALRNAEIWIDAGTASRSAARAVLAAPVTTLVVGTEALESITTLIDIIAEAPARTVLSLDFLGDEYMGPPALLKDPALWPNRVIVMTLGRVGGSDGPDIERIREIAAKGAGRKVYAAGGIRDRADLDAVKAAGAAGALVASALHGQKISAGDLTEIAGRKS